MTILVRKDSFLWKRISNLSNMAYGMLSDNDVLIGVNGIKTFGNDVVKWKSQWDDGRVKRGI